jgi:hypothetical protein
MQAPSGTAALSLTTSSLLPSTSALVPRVYARHRQYRGTLAEELVALVENLGTRAACLCRRPPVPRHGCRGPRRSCRILQRECRVHSTPFFGHAALLHSAAELVPSTAGRSPRSSERNCCAFLSDAAQREVTTAAPPKPAGSSPISAKSGDHEGLVHGWDRARGCSLRECASSCRSAKTTSSIERERDCEGHAPARSAHARTGARAPLHHR